MIKEIIDVTEKKEYESILKGIANREDRVVSILPFTSKKLQQLLQDKVLGNPDFFFVRGFKIIERGTTKVVCPRYDYSRQEIIRLSNECDKRAEKLIKRVSECDEYEKVKELHDFLAKNVEYVDDRKKERYSIIGPFLEKKSVCEGFAKAYKYLLDRIGIPCLVLSGKAYDPCVGKNVSHSWNMVKIEDKWCHVDVTFDATIRCFNFLRYDYFALSTKEIKRDHVYNEDNYPIADDSEMSYYARNNLIINGKKEFRNHVIERIKSNEYDFVIKVPEDAPEVFLEKKVLKVLGDTITDLGISCTYLVNYNIRQKVFHIHVEKE